MMLLLQLVAVVLQLVVVGVGEGLLSHGDEGKVGTASRALWDANDDGGSVWMPMM